MRRARRHGVSRSLQAADHNLNDGLVPMLVARHPGGDRADRGFGRSARLSAYIPHDEAGILQPLALAVFDLQQRPHIPARVQSEPDRSRRRLVQRPARPFRRRQDIANLNAVHLDQVVSSIRIPPQGRPLACGDVQRALNKAGPPVLQVRCLASARSAPVAFDLRCEIREKLMAFMRDECREALPRDRIEWPQGEERSISPPEPTGPG